MSEDKLTMNSGHKPKTGWWNQQMWKIVILPVLAAVLLALVGIGKGFLHRQAGFDSEGKSLWDEPNNQKQAENAATRRAVQAPSQTLTIIADDLGRLELNRRTSHRYLTLAHRWNDPRQRDADLDSWRQALQQLAETHGQSARVIAIPAVDRDRTVYRLDLEQMNSPPEQWHEWMSIYPYGLSLESGSDKRSGELERRIHDLSEEPLCHVRLDWFLCRVVHSRATAASKTENPLPETLRALIRSYSTQPVDLQTAAAELGLETSTPLREALEKTEVLREEFRLAPLLRGEAVPRDWWESDRNLISPFQELAQQLNLGNPLRFR